LQYKIFSCIAVVLHLCGPLQYNAAIQVFYNLQKTCRLLAAVVKQESRAVAREPRDIAAVVFGLKFADNIHY